MLMVVGVVAVQLQIRWSLPLVSSHIHPCDMPLLIQQMVKSSTKSSSGTYVQFGYANQYFL
ncbi:hypothetical protein ERO13_A01G161680v2 [Gossypium hirsutum]|nr:hypothetical protein ERO13_A01G161680v2 [Gossypium hirsutum]